MPKYAIHKVLDISYEDALEKVPAALKTEGFGVLTEIDVKATLKKKLDVDFRKYKILGACNPPLAHKALSAELDVGVLLPCNVVVWENDEGKTTIAAMDPYEVMASLIDNPEVKGLAEEVRTKITRALDTL